MWGITRISGLYHCYVLTPANVKDRKVCSTEGAAIRWVQSQMYTHQGRMMALDEIQSHIEDVALFPPPKPSLLTRILGVFK